MRNRKRRQQRKKRRTTVKWELSQEFSEDEKKMLNVERDFTRTNSSYFCFSAELQNREWFGKTWSPFSVRFYCVYLCCRLVHNFAIRVRATKSNYAMEIFN